jgi:serine phosphatase RsbU (regulator of sigma subunit)
MSKRKKRRAGQAETVAAHPPRPGLIATLRRDLQQVFGDVASWAPRATVARTIEDLDEFYLYDEERERLARTGPVRRWMLRLWWLFKGLVLKLTPARRLLLALGLVMRVAEGVRFTTGTGADVSINTGAVGLGLILLVLALELKDKLVAHDELEAGRAVQLALMPARPPAIEGWDVWMYTQSANEVGGDLVDHVPVDEGSTALLLADVAGKGLSAALLTAKLQATLRALVTECRSLVHLGECVNQIMYRDGVRGRFATLVCLVVRTETGEVRVLNAGHMAPLVVRGDAIEELPRGGVALGMVSATSFAEQRATLQPGEAIVVYSDGVTEAMNAAREFFGDERLEQILAGQRGRSAEAVGTAVVRAVSAFVAATPPHDDVSLIVLRRTA